MNDYVFVCMLAGLFGMSWNVFVVVAWAKIRNTVIRVCALHGVADSSKSNAQQI